MLRRHLLPLVLAALAVAPVVAGCAGLPVQQMSDARQAITAAEQAGAAEYAPELLAESKRLVDRAKANLNEGEYRQSPEQLAEFKQYSMCINCALCYAACPVLAVGPRADVSRGLPLVELVVVLDGSPEAAQILPVAAALARDLKLRLILLGVVPGEQDEGIDEPGHEAEQRYLEARFAEVAPAVAEAEMALVAAPDRATGIVGFLDDHRDAVLAMTTHGRGGLDRRALDDVAQDVVLRSRQAVILVRPTAGAAGAGTAPGQPFTAP